MWEFKELTETQKIGGRKKGIFILCNNLAISCLHERFLFLSFITGAGLFVAQYILDLRHTKKRERNNLFFAIFLLTFFWWGKKIPKGLQEHQNAQQLFMFTFWITSIFCPLEAIVKHVLHFFYFLCHWRGKFPLNFSRLLSLENLLFMWIWLGTTIIEIPANFEQICQWIFAA